MTPRRWLVAIVVCAAVLRFFPIWFGLPYAQARPDETAALGLAVSVRSGDLNPHFFHWPSLAIYTFAAVHAGLSWARAAVLGDPTLTFGELAVSARAVVAAAGTLTVLVLYTIGRRMGGPTIGLLSALFLATSILHVRDSHFAMTDVLMTLFSTASLALLLRALEADAMRPLRRFAAAGFVGGLATSTKYNAGAVLAAMAAAQLWWIARSSATPWRLQAWFPSGAFVAAFALGFVAGTPYAVLDYRTFAADLWFDLTHLSGGHGIDLGRGWVYHATTTLPYGLGIPVFIAALAGIVPMARRYPRHTVVVGTFAVAFYGLIGSGQTVFFRYVMPIVPVLCLPAAVAVEGAAVWLAGRTAWRPATALVIVATLVGGMGLVNCVWFDVLLSRSDSRVLAARWLSTRIKTGDSLYDSGGNYAQLDLSHLPYHSWSWDAASESFGHPGGELPDWLVLHESAVTPYTRIPLGVATLARAKYHLIHTVPATSPRPGAAVYDLQDAFFMPVSRFDEVRRPGPTVRIYRRRDASSLFESDDQTRDKQ